MHLHDGFRTSVTVPSSATLRRMCAGMSAKVENLLDGVPERPLGEREPGRELLDTRASATKS